MNKSVQVPSHSTKNNKGKKKSYKILKKQIEFSRKSRKMLKRQFLDEDSSDISLSNS